MGSIASILVEMSSYSLLVIGATGTGKSTLCNVLAGRKHDDGSLFPVSDAMSSCTNKTTAKNLLWRGIRDLPFTLVDTPGLNDPEPGRDSLNIAEMTEELKKMKHVNVFLIVFNGSNPRFDHSLIAILKIFQGMFGNEFLKQNTVFEFTNWAHDRKSKRRRGITKNEDYWKDELNKKLRELVGCSSDIPAVFIDACHDPEDEEEVDTFQREMSKLQSYLQTFPPYECKDFKAVKTELDKMAAEKENLEGENRKLEDEVGELEDKLAAEKEKMEKEKKKLEEDMEKRKKELEEDVEKKKKRLEEDMEKEKKKLEEMEKKKCEEEMEKEK